MSPRELGGKAIAPARTSMNKSPKPMVDAGKSPSAKAKSPNAPNSNRGYSNKSKSPSASYAKLKSVTKSPAFSR